MRRPKLGNEKNLETEDDPYEFAGQNLTLQKKKCRNGKQDNGNSREHKNKRGKKREFIGISSKSVRGAATCRRRKREGGIVKKIDQQEKILMKVAAQTEKGKPAVFVGLVLREIHRRKAGGKEVRLRHQGYRKENRELNSDQRIDLMFILGVETSCRGGEKGNDNQSAVHVPPERVGSPFPKPLR